MSHKETLDPYEQTDQSAPDPHWTWKTRDSASQQERWPDGFLDFCLDLEREFPAWFVSFSPKRTSDYPRGCFTAVVYRGEADRPIQPLTGVTIGALRPALRDADPTRFRTPAPTAREAGRQ